MRPVLAICALAVVLRLAASAIFIGINTPAAFEPAADSRLHMTLTESVLAGRGFSVDGAPTAMTPPLYVGFLAVLYAIFGEPWAVRITQALLGGVACFLVYEIARRLLDRSAAMWAALMMAVFPHSVYLSALHLTENLFLILVLLVILQALRAAQSPGSRQAITLGVLVGLTALTRSAFLAFVPMLALWGTSIWGAASRTAWRVFAISVAGVMLVLAPWVARNFVALGEIVPVQSNGGMVFWAGNNPHSDGGLVWPDARTWNAGPPPNDGWHAWRELSIKEENRLFVTTAIRWIREHPRDFLALLPKKLVRLYGFSKADGGNLAIPLPVKFLYIAFMAVALTGAFVSARAWRPHAVLFLLIVFTNVMTLIFSGGSRYLISMVPALVVFAGAGLAWGERLIARTVKMDRVPVGT